MSDASFMAAGYAIMIEDDPNQKLQYKRKTCAQLRLDQNHSIKNRRKCQYMRKSSFPYILHLLNLDISCGETPSQSLCSQTTAQYINFYKQK